MYLSVTVPYKTRSFLSFLPAFPTVSYRAIVMTSLFTILVHVPRGLVPRHKFCFRAKAGNEAPRTCTLYNVAIASLAHTHTHTHTHSLSHCARIWWPSHPAVVSNSSPDCRFVIAMEGRKIASLKLCRMWDNHAVDPCTHMHCTCHALHVSCSACLMYKDKKHDWHMFKGRALRVPPVCCEWLRCTYSSTYNHRNPPDASMYMVITAGMMHIYIVLSFSQFSTVLMWRLMTCTACTSVLCCNVTTVVDPEFENGGGGGEQRRCIQM